MSAAPTISLLQATTRVGVSRRALYYWMQQGRLPYTKRHVSRRVRLADVLALRLARAPTSRSRHEGQGGGRKGRACG